MNFIIRCHRAELKAFLILTVMIAQYFLVLPWQLIPAIGSSVTLTTALITTAVDQLAREPYCCVDMLPASSTIGSGLLHIMLYSILSSKQTG